MRVPQAAVWRGSVSYPNSSPESLFGKRVRQRAKFGKIGYPKVQWDVIEECRKGKKTLEGARGENLEKAGKRHVVS